MARTKIVTGMEKGPEAIEAGFELMDKTMALKYGKLSDVGTFLNGVTCSDGGQYSLQVIDPVNNIGLLTFGAVLAKTPINIAGYATLEAFQFNTALFTESVAGSPLMDAYAYNGWGNLIRSYQAGSRIIGMSNQSSTAITGGGLEIQGQMYVNL